MRIDRSLLNWGVFLVALGGIPLAVDQGWLESDIARDLGQLWPLILVGIGLGLILRWTPIAWFGGALVAATFGIIFGAAVVALPDEDISNLQGIIPAIASGACASGDAGPGRTSEAGLADPDVFELELTLSCGDLAVERAADASWRLDATHAQDDTPTIDRSDLDGATSALALDQPADDDFSFLGRQARSDWRVEVPAAAAITASATLNAVRARIELGDGPLAGVAGTFNASDVVLNLAAATTPSSADIGLTLNASDVRLLLPDGGVSARATLNASSLTVCVPAGVPLRVESTSNLSSDDLGSSGLLESGPTLWTTPGFSAATEHVYLSITSTVSSFSLLRPESCS
jgi:hypothetical protein